MAFDRVIGQHRVKSFFQKALENGRISHAYLLIGERGVGKEAMALEFSKALFCSHSENRPCQVCSECLRIQKLSHPDLHFLFPAPAKVKESDLQKILQSIVEDPYQRLELWANPSITIERIRQIKQATAYKSTEGKGRIFILVDVERMTQEAANALLKILEEPPDRTFLILTSSKPNLLFPTIISRCQLVKFDPLSVEEIEQALITKNHIDANQARLLARLASGSYRKALELLDEDLQFLRTLALDFFRQCVQHEYNQLIFVEDLLHKIHGDAKKVKDLLTMVLFWFRDALIYSETGEQEPERLVNYDQIEVLQKFVQKFPNADLYNAIIEIENSLVLMDRNVQLYLILIVLLNKLKKYLRR